MVRRRFRPVIEALEDRCLTAVLGPACHFDLGQAPEVTTGKLAVLGESDATLCTGNHGNVPGSMNAASEEFAWLTHAEALAAFNADLGYDIGVADDDLSAQINSSHSSPKNDHELPDCLLCQTVPLHGSAGSDLLGEKAQSDCGHELSLRLIADSLELASHAVSISYQLSDEIGHSQVWIVGKETMATVYHGADSATMGSSVWGNPGQFGEKALPANETKHIPVSGSDVGQFDLNSAASEKALSANETRHVPVSGNDVGPFGLNSAASVNDAGSTLLESDATAQTSNTLRRAGDGIAPYQEWIVTLGEETGAVRAATELASKSPPSQTHPNGQPGVALVNEARHESGQLRLTEARAPSLFMGLEQKIESLCEEAGELKRLLKKFLAIAAVDLSSALTSARRAAEHLVNAVLGRERLDPRRDLLDNIETLGSRDAKPSKRRGGLPPILPAPIYSALHALRIYGNLANHPYEPGTTELKNVVVNSTDIQAALAQLLRVVEWYYEDYDKGPRLGSVYRGSGQMT